MAQHSLLSFPNYSQPSQFLRPDKNREGSDCINEPGQQNTAFCTTFLPLRHLKLSDSSWFRCLTCPLNAVLSNTNHVSASCPVTFKRKTENWATISDFFFTNHSFHHFSQWIIGWRFIYLLSLLVCLCTANANGVVTKWVKCRNNLSICCSAVQRSFHSSILPNRTSCTI